MQQSDQNWPDLTLLEAAPILIWRSGLDAMCNWFNTAWLEYRGRKMEQELGNGWAEGVHPDDFERCLKIYLEAFEARRKFDMEYRILMANGEYGWIADYGVPVHSNNGEFIGYVGYCFDITDRYKSEKAAREKEIELRAIYDSSSVSIFHFGVDGKITQANRRMAEMFLCSVSEIVGSNYFSHLHRSCIEDAEKNLADLLEHEGKLEVERIYIRSDKTEFWGLLSVERVFDEKRNVIGFVGVVVDINDQKLAEFELEKAFKNLEHSNSELEQFAYVASHDLREPLRMISGYASLIERRYSGSFDADGHEFLGYIREGAQRLDQMVLGLLAYSRIDRRGDPIQQISPCEIVSVALLNLHAAIEESQASVEVNISNCPDVMADKSQITRVFQNIIGNSIKYRRCDVQPHILVECTDLGDMVEFRIGDNGIGISSEFYDRIFGLFQRLHTRQAIEGNGIGLAVCKKVIERHRGKIFVEAEPGSGATFKFTLVKADTPLAAELLATAPPPQPSSSGR